MSRDELIDLIRDIQSQIDDDCRAYEDSGEPGILLTIACDDDGEIAAYQTGDTQFHGACYHYPHWASDGIYRDTKPEGMAEQMIDDLADTVACNRDW